MQIMPTLQGSSFPGTPQSVPYNLPANLLQPGQHTALAHTNMPELPTPQALAFNNHPNGAHYNPDVWHGASSSNGSNGGLSTSQKSNVTQMRTYTNWMEDYISNIRLGINEAISQMEWLRYQNEQLRSYLETMKYHQRSLENNA